jgi:GMP synthase-like glutamine amidotransferase
MLPCTQKLSELKFTPKGIILSGGPYSVYEEGSPHVDPAVFDLSKLLPPNLEYLSPMTLTFDIIDVPILGICCT